MTTIGEQARFVATAAIRRAVAGRETDVLDALGVDWRAGRPHMICPYPGHDDGDPSWRWDAHKCRAFCTCTKSDSVFDVVMKVEDGTFEAAKVRVAELLNRHDLIRPTGGGGSSQRYQATDAASLLNAPADLRDDSLPLAYLAYRLGIAPDAVPIPSTPMIGLKTLAYYDPLSSGSRAKPKLVGEFPCAVFGTVAADGRTHAHRIYLASGGVGKADLGAGPDGRRRDPKKSAKALGNDNTAGRSVLWGDASRAFQIVIAEGVETGAAAALALAAEIEAGDMAVAAAISANGIEAFQPYSATKRVTVAADRDEAAKTKGAPVSRRGERAAREFGLRHHERLTISIALPGKPGESVDWLDVLRRDGIEALRSGLSAAALFVPTQAELDELARGVGRAAEPQRTAEPLPKSRRPAIRVMGGDLADATAAALRVLAGECDPLRAVYVRGSLLMRPTRVRERLNAGSIRRPLDALILRAVDVDWLRLRLAQLADFYVVVRKELKPVDVPLGVCRCSLAAAPWDGLPTLTGVIEAPTILPDGSMIQEPGYDPVTGLLFDPGDTQFPQVPSEPTRAQAEVALRTLSAPFNDFPFIDDPTGAARRQLRRGHLGAMYWIGRQVPPTLSATAQSLYSAIVFGVFLGAMLYGAGWLYAALARAAFLPMAAAGLIGAAFAWPLRREGDAITPSSPTRRAPSAASR